MALDISSEVAIRWNDCDGKYVPLLKEGGITMVLVERREEGFERACGEAGIKVKPLEEIKFLSLGAMGSGAGGGLVALTNGLWPGVSRRPGEGSDEFTASATARPWVDANGYLVGMLRTLYPARPALLGYLPDEKAGVKADALLPYETLELALVEARVNGGNYLLALEPRYRERLLGGEGKALEAWRQMGQTARWLGRNGELFCQGTFPIITALVEADEGLAEIISLLYRHNASPALASAANPPGPDPMRRLALVAVGIHAPSAEIGKRLMSHAEAGTALIVDAAGAEAWWRDARLKLVRKQEDRDFYSLGRGQVVAYHEPISDPGEFAFDVIDIVTQKRRAARLWNADQVIARASFSPRGEKVGRAMLLLVNYGSRLQSEVLAGIQGVYKQARLLQPEAEALSLVAAKRGTHTEVMMPELGRVGALVVG